MRFFSRAKKKKKRDRKIIHSLIREEWGKESKIWDKQRNSFGKYRLPT